MRYFIILLLSLLALPLQAAVKVDVYSAEVIIDSDQADADQLAREKGFEQVIVKASGDKAAADNPVVQKAEGQSERFLSQLGYGDNLGMKTLKMAFNPPQIQTLLSNANLPYWDPTRASVLVWVVYDGEYGRELLWQESGHRILNQLQYFSSLRGLPLVIPDSSSQSGNAISAAEIWGGFTESISQASNVYPSDAVLVVRVQGTEDNAQVSWTLYDENSNYITSSNKAPVTGQSTGGELKVLENMVDDVANYYAGKSALKNSNVSTNTVLAEFQNVNSAVSLFNLEALLKKQDTVASIELSSVKGSSVLFDINLFASQDEFVNDVVQNTHIRQSEPEQFVAPAYQEPATQNDGDIPTAVTDAPVSDDGADISTESMKGSDMTNANDVQEPAPSFVVESPTDATLYFEWTD